MALFIIAFITLLIGSFFDIRCCTDIPIGLFPAGTILSILLSAFLTPHEMKWKLCIALAVFIAFLIEAWMFRLGGADVIAFVMLSFTTGFDVFPIILLTYMLSVPHAIYIRFSKKGNTYPLIPYIFASFVIIMLFRNGFP